MRPEPARKAFARGRRLAKRPPDVQQSGGVFPAVGGARKCEKAAGIQRLCLTFRSVEYLRLEPLAPVAMFHATAATPITVIAIPAVPPAFAGSASHMMRQDGQPAFLAVVEGLVERVSRVSDLLH